ncbi:MAG: PorV/PorQ family protein [Flavobacteriales bacterium]|nr:PorV/PorQ family protein [Flavobacteriales bacterium]
MYLHASAQTAPKYSNEFLGIGVSARAAGMSNSILAGVDDVSAGFWNPSALVHMKDKAQLAYMHNNYFGGIGNYDYGALGFRMSGDQAASVSFVRLGIDGIPNTLDLINNGQIDYDRIREFSAVDYAFLFSYARKTAIEGLSLGGNAKVIHRKAGEFATAWGFGVDVSASYINASGWRFAAVGRDITSTFNAWSYNFTQSEKEVFAQTGNAIPENSLELTLPKLLLGAGRYFELSEKIGLYPELNMDVTTDGKRNTLLRSGLFSIDPHLGLEANYAKLIFLRLGAGNFQQVESFSGKNEWTWQPNFGVGLTMPRFALDYALTDVGNQSDVLYSHVFSVRFNIVEE